MGLIFFLKKYEREKKLIKGKRFIGNWGNIDKWKENTYLMD